MQRRLELSKADFVLIAFFLTLLSSSLTMYVQGFPLRRYLFNLADEEAGLPIGTVRIKQGTLIREQRGEAEFRPLIETAPVFVEDTVVTGPNSSATLMLDDGGVIELGSSTMIKLSFENDFSFDGISRAAKIKIVAGTVTGQAKKRRIVLASGEERVRLSRTQAQPMKLSAPKIVAATPVQEVVSASKPDALPILAASPIPVASPAPVAAPPAARTQPLVKVKIQSPAPGTRLRIADGAKVAEKKIELRWEVSPKAPPLTLVVRQGEREILKTAVEARGGIGSMALTLKRPGEYEWELLAPEGASFRGAKTPASSFVLEPDFESIEVYDPLVAGNKVASSRLQGERLKSFDLTFSWAPYPEAKDYRIWFASAPDASKPLLEKTLSKTDYTLNKGKILTGKIWYRISTVLPSGFRVSSKTQPFIFDFLPPILVIPNDRATVQPRPGADSSVLMTWQKMNFTDAYLLEISSEENFRSTIVKRKSEENFYVFKPSGAGTFYWRVRAYSGQVASPVSQVSQFQFQESEPLAAPSPATEAIAVPPN